MLIIRIVLMLNNKLCFQGRIQIAQFLPWICWFNVNGNNVLGLFVRLVFLMTIGLQWMAVDPACISS